MRFMTPDLLERFGSDDDEVASLAHDEFERRSGEYRRESHEIGDKLPRRFSEMQDQSYLHDARVLTPLFPWLPGPSHGEVSGEGRSFLIALNLDPPPGQVLVLHYRGVHVEQAVWHPSLREGGGTSLEWLYDEVDLVRTDGGDEFRQSILLSDGLEIRLRFRDFDFAILKPMEDPRGLADATLAGDDTRGRAQG